MSASQLEQLDAQVKNVWERGQTLHKTTGVLAFLRWAVPLFLVGMTIDWLIDLPAVVRGVLLVMLLAVSLYRAWQCGWRKLCGFNATHSALQLENHHGDLDSLLVTAIQMRDAAAASGTSDAMRDRTCKLAEEAAPTLRPEDAVPYSGLRKPGLGVLLLTMVLGIFALVNGPFLSAGFNRIFTPWIASTYPTDTVLDLGEGDLVVKQGARAQIEAKVSGVVPKQANILLRTGEGRPRERDLDIIDGRCTYTINSASRDFSYQIKAGDARSAWHQVRVIPAPRIQQVEVSLEYPKYLDRESDCVEALTLTVPEGTGINWHLVLDRPVSKASFIRDGEEPVDLALSKDGQRIKFNAMASDSRGYQFSWIEKEHGFDFTSPRYYLQVASDQPPQIELTSPVANLVAMTGRPLDLVVRARDDHAIDTARINVRVNRRAEESVVLPSALRNGEGEQVIDWDYREALPDLKVGDTVSFAVEVSDRYPGEQGPHRARSETRRITFLSREEYLEQIGRKRDRLLSRVRTIYRQERVAHDLVRNLDPKADSFMQTCQLEAIRQEMVRNQLHETAVEVQALFDDLVANNVSDAPEGESLVQVRTAMQTIAEQHVARAAALLREQASASDSDPAPAARVVNTAARELGSLVLMRDIDSAREVFARETHMLAQMQASVRWQAMARGKSAPDLAEKQEALAQWTDRLLSDVQGGMRFIKRPLAVLRLMRSVKELRATDFAARMPEAAAQLREGKAADAAAVQADLVRSYLSAEYSVRPTGEYTNLLKARDLLGELVTAQRDLRIKAGDLPPAQLEKQQFAIRRALNLMLLPTIPAARPQLFDSAFPDRPPIEDLLAEADRALAAQPVLKAERVLSELAEIVSQWAVEVGVRTQGLSTMVASANDRLTQIEDFETRQIELLEETDIAAAEDQKVEPVAEAQLFLAQDVAAFQKELEEQHALVAEKDVLPILSRLRRVQPAAHAAVDALKKNLADEALLQQEIATDALSEALMLVTAQSERLSLLQDLFMFQRSVGYANGYMANIVDEQNDLTAATEDAKPEAVSGLLPLIENQRKCFVEVAPLLDLVAGRLDVGTPLVFAGTDLEDAIDSLKAGDTFDAFDAQDVAGESLAEVQDLVQAVHTETAYVAEIVEFLHRALVNASILEFQQQELAQKVETANAEELAALVSEQRAMVSDAETRGLQLEKATGMAEYLAAAEQMKAALNAMEAGDAAAAFEQLDLVNLTLSEQAETLFAIITMLHGLPSIEVTSASPVELHRLIDVLAVASAHKELLRNTQGAEAQALPELAAQQAKLVSRCTSHAEASEPHLKLVAAHKQLQAAAAALQVSDLDLSRRSQQVADDHLRHFVVEQALILETAKVIGPAVDGDPMAGGEGSDAESAMSASFISDFVAGEAPKDKRTEWKVLGDRNRAALNQNFARELPLEYRGLLKNYYERVAE